MKTPQEQQFIASIFHGEKPLIDAMTLVTNDLHKSHYFHTIDREATRKLVDAMNEFVVSWNKSKLEWA